MTIFRVKEWADVKAERGKWHRWFAWYPVATAHGERTWLETVERKFIYPPVSVPLAPTVLYRRVGNAEPGQ